MQNKFVDLICLIKDENGKEVFWRTDDKDFTTYNVLSQETELLELVKPYLNGNRIMIQAGGNCGLQVEKFALYFQSVYTFEPDPKSFHCLVNNLPYKNVIKLQACLGEKRTSIFLNLDPNDIGGNFVGKESGTIEIDLDSGSLGGNVSKNYSGYVPLIRIDDMNLPHCDMIQLDIEGSELNALYGSNETIKKYKPVIVVELCEPWLNRYGHTPSLVRQHLSSLGYVQVNTYTTDYIFVHKDKL